VKTNGDFGSCSRCSRRGTRSSSPRIGCIAGVPALARRTARVAQSNRSDPKGDPSTRSNAGRPCTPPGSCGVAMSPSVPLGGIDQLVDLGLGQKLQRSKFRVWLSYWHHDCAVLVGWHNQPQRWIRHWFPSSMIAIGRIMIPLRTVSTPIAGPTHMLFSVPLTATARAHRGWNHVGRQSQAVDRGRRWIAPATPPHASGTRPRNRRLIGLAACALEPRCRQGSPVILISRETRGRQLTQSWSLKSHRRQLI